MGRILIGKVTHPLKDNLETPEPGQGSLDAHQGKVLKGLIGSLGLDIGDLTALQTTDKDNLVNAINNLAEAVSTLNGNMATKTDLLYVNVNSNTSTGGFDKNFLLVNISTVGTESQQTAYFSKPVDDEDWLNIPSDLQGKVWIGIRTVMQRSSIHVMVKVEEMYPVTGRIWYNFYNNGTWTNWKSISPS